ncbi:MAG TPA: AMIN domain-containing protein, partial [Myxococcales bacterium]
PSPTATATANTTPSAATSTSDPAPAEIPEVRERAGLPTVSLVGSGRPESTEGRPAAIAERTKPAPAKGHAAITGIGFRPQFGGEVIVRSDRPLQYGVSSSDRAVLLHLPNAAIPVANNRRPLDTRFFGGPVQRVVPHEVKGGTEVRIELREPAEVHLNQSGSLLTVSFTPGS